MRRSEGAFTLLEALTALSLLGFVLAFFLPSYLSLIESQQREAEATQEWRIFYELARVSFAEDDSSLREEALIRNYNASGQGRRVEAFACEAELCQIWLEGGEAYTVAREDS